LLASSRAAQPHAARQVHRDLGDMAVLLLGHGHLGLIDAVEEPLQLEDLLLDHGAQRVGHAVKMPGGDAQPHGRPPRVLMEYR